VRTDANPESSAPRVWSAVGVRTRLSASGSRWCGHVAGGGRLPQSGVTSRSSSKFFVVRSGISRRSHPLNRTAASPSERSGIVLTPDEPPCDRDQPMLLPPDLRDWLDDDHLAWFVIDAVAELDYAALAKAAKSGRIEAKTDLD
jgi:hypothetical protein